MNNYYSDPLKMYPFILIKICPGHFCSQDHFFLAVGTGGNIGQGSLSLLLLESYVGCIKELQ
jgi:hypothetical protein